MHGLSKYKWIILFVSLIFTLILLTLWLIPSQPSIKEHKQKDPLSSLTPNIANSPSNESILPKHNTQSVSQQDTEINCQLSINSDQKLIINEKTKNCFEYFISQYGEKNLIQLKADFIHYVQANYKEPVISQLIDIWERYLEYRQQLAHIAKPDFHPESAAYYRKIFDDTLQLKQRIFSNVEIEGLFGQEALYDQYTLQRMDIYANQDLNEAEKAKKLQELINTLPEDWQENLKQLKQLEDLRSLTSDIKNRGGTTEEIKEMRLNLVGIEATQRLEQLDKQRESWKIRVNDYLNQRDIILSSSMSEIAQQHAIQSLKNQHFSNSEEKLRIETFENLHDQKQPLPFPE